MPRPSYQAEPSHYTGELSDLDERGNIGAAVMPQNQRLPRYRNAVPHRYMQVTDFRLAVESAAQHIECSIAHNGVEVRSHYVQSDAECHNPCRRDPEQVPPNRVARKRWHSSPFPVIILATWPVQAGAHARHARRDSDALTGVNGRKITGSFWGAWWDSNPRHPEPQSGVPPLNYRHHAEGYCSL